MKIKLNNGLEIPQVGFGLYKMEPGQEAEQSVLWALEAGYKHIDTASRYKNEEDVRRAIKKSGIPREEIFVTTKLWNDDFDEPKKALNLSLEKLGLKYVDLYLIHWPVPGKRLKAWKAMEGFLEEGKCRAIGVSNCAVHHLKEFLENCSVPPAVNQVEFHPWLYQKELLEFCKSKNIVVEAYSPLTRGEKLSDPKILEIAKKYSKTSAQVILRWGIQHGIVVLPKSKTKERIKENLDVFDFSLKKEDMEKIDMFNENLRIQGRDPNNKEWE